MPVLNIAFYPCDFFKEFMYTLKWDQQFLELWEELVNKNIKVKRI